MNLLIQEIKQLGLSADVYNLINYAGMAIAFVYSLYFGKKLQLPLWKTITIVIVLDAVALLFGTAIGELVRYLGDIGFLKFKSPRKSMVRLLAFLPLLAIPLTKILRLKRSSVCDTMALCLLLNCAIAQLACVFTGCCYGYEWEYGIYSVRTGLFHFPVQILETGLTLLIFGYLTSLCKGKKYETGGTLYPLMLILYGIVRLFCEALRDNDKLVFGMSAIAIHSALMMIVGAVWLYILSRKKEKTYGHSIQTLEAQEGEAGQDPEGSQGGEGGQV